MNTHTQKYMTINAYILYMHNVFFHSIHTYRFFFFSRNTYTQKRYQTMNASMYCMYELYTYTHTVHEYIFFLSCKCVHEYIHTEELQDPIVSIIVIISYYHCLFCMYQALGIITYYHQLSLILQKRYKTPFSTSPLIIITNNTKSQP